MDGRDLTLSSSDSTMLLVEIYSVNSLEDFAMMLIDLATDRGYVHFTHIKNTVQELPEFVKQANIDDCSAIEDLPPIAFADPINRKFPIHTKAAAMISYLYFKSQEDKLQKMAANRIRSRFTDSGRLWGIRTEMAQADERFQPQVEKEASADDYALTADGQHFLPINTSENIVKSAAELIESRQNLPYDMRKEAATRIMQAAVAHGFETLDLPDELHRMAGFGFTTKEAMLHEIKRRELYAAGMRSPIRETLNKLANSLANAETTPKDTVEKVAQVIDTVDRTLGITSLYGTDFSFPEDVLFSFTEKSAAHIKASKVPMTTGTVYDLEDLAKDAQVFRVFGDDFYNDVVRTDGSVDLQKVADVLPTMPKDSAALFDRLMRRV